MDLPILDDTMPRTMRDSARSCHADRMPGDADALFSHHVARPQISLGVTEGWEQAAGRTGRTADRCEAHASAADAPPLQRRVSDAEADEAQNDSNRLDDGSSAEAARSPTESADSSNGPPAAPIDPRDSRGDITESGGTETDNINRTSAEITERATTDSPLEASSAGDRVDATGNTTRPQGLQQSTDQQTPSAGRSQVTDKLPSAASPCAEEVRAAVIPSPAIVADADHEAVKEKTATDKAVKHTAKQVTRLDRDNATPESHSATIKATAVSPPHGTGQVTKTVDKPDDETSEQTRAAAMTDDRSSNTAQTASNSRPATPAERFSEHLAARTGPRVDKAHDMSPGDQFRLIQRVARAIHAAPQRGGLIRLRLRPPELGSLHLEVHLQKGALSARLEAETQMARAALLENLPQLRERLAEQGIRIEHFEVDVSRRDAGSFQQPTYEPDEHPETHVPSRMRSDSGEANESEDDATGPYRFHAPGKLNVVI